MSNGMIEAWNPTKLYILLLNVKKHSYATFEDQKVIKSNPKYFSNTSENKIQSKDAKICILYKIRRLFDL